MRASPVYFHLQTTPIQHLHYVRTDTLFFYNLQETTNNSKRAKLTRQFRDFRALQHPESLHSRHEHAAKRLSVFFRILGGTNVFSKTNTKKAYGQGTSPTSILSPSLSSYTRVYSPLPSNKPPITFSPSSLSFIPPLQSLCATKHHSTNNQWRFEDTAIIQRTNSWDLNLQEGLWIVHQPHTIASHNCHMLSNPLSVQLEYHPCWSSQMDYYLTRFPQASGRKLCPTPHWADPKLT